VSVFSDQQERPTVVASDPQRGVGLDQTPLRVLATTACLRRRTSADIRRHVPAMQLHFTSEVACWPAASVLACVSSDRPRLMD
jgi:hypothetical protein